MLIKYALAVWRTLWSSALNIPPAPHRSSSSPCSCNAVVVAGLEIALLLAAGVNAHSTEISDIAGAAVVANHPAEVTDPAPTGTVCPGLGETDSWVTAAELAQRIREGSGSAVLVDVRDAESFRRFRVPGSINVPLHTLKTKDFLKRNVVILISDGFDRDRLAEELLVLRSAGFESVAALIGGLAAWAGAIGSLEGEEVRSANLQAVSPASLYLEKDRVGILFVHVDPVPGDSTRAVFHHAVSLPLTADRDAFLKQVRREIAQHRGEGRLALLLLTESGAGHPELLELASRYRANEAVDVDWYFLDGGLKRYGEFVATQRQHGGSEARKGIAGCGTCP